MHCKLSQLLDVVPGRRLHFKEAEIRGISCDSRRIKRGFLFVAISGASTNGSRFVHEAIERGAAAIVCEEPPTEEFNRPFYIVSDARKALADLASRFYSEPSDRLNVIGITGTNGKSTTGLLIRSILTAAREKSGILGTIRYELGSRSLSAPMTTPPADDLQEYLWEMANAGCRSAVMEVSSHALSQDRVRGVHFAVGIFTNLTRDHLDYHSSFEEYRDAKGRLFRDLSSRSIAVLNVDDPASEVYAKQTKGILVRYGLDQEAEVTADIDLLDIGGCRFQLCLGEERVPVVSRLIGRHNIYNMLAAAATCWKMGYDIEAIRIGLESVASVPGRLQAVEAGQNFNVFIDYAHTDDAMENVLSSLRPICAGRLIVVFGCGGDRDRGKRPRMGRIADQLADQLVLTSDNPRTEEPLEIIREISSGVTSMNYLIEPDRRAAIRLAVSMARKGDLVLVAGKGHESVQVIGTEVRPFDDLRVTKEVLSGLIRKLRKSS